MSPKRVRTMCAIAALGAAPVLVQADPTFVYTGGVLMSSAEGADALDLATIPLDADLGSFEAFSSVSVEVIDPADISVPADAVAESLASADKEATTLRVSGEVDGFRDFLFDPFGEEVIFGGSATASVAFTLTEPGLVAFEWFGDAWVEEAIATASLRHAGGDAVLSCFGGPSFTSETPGGSCFDGDPVSETPSDLGATGAIALAAGDYEVLLSADDVIAAGTSSGGRGTLALIVPTPTTTSLIVCGLMGLGARIRTRKSS